MKCLIFSRASRDWTPYLVFILKGDGCKAKNIEESSRFCRELAIFREVCYSINWWYLGGFLRYLVI